MLMVETDHDMRNSADFISLDRVAKDWFALPGVAMVQSITRPLGRPLDHANVPYLFTTQGGAAGQQLPFNQQQNADTDKQAQIQADTVTVLGKTIDVTQQLSDDLHATVLTTENLARSPTTSIPTSPISTTSSDLSRTISIGSHTVSTSHMWAFRSLFDGLDGIDGLDAEIAHTVTDLQAVDALLPQLVTQLKILMDDTQSLQAVIVNSYGPAHLQSTQTNQTFDDQINVGNDFDQSRSDDYFYMPREGLDNDDVKTGMTLMMSPDGKAARFIVTHEGNALGPEGVEHVEAFPDAVRSALKETSLAGSRIYIGGAASNDKDIKEYAASDLLIVAIAAFVLIFLIMLFLTRSLMAAILIPGTVAFSFAGAFGLSILVWQHLIGLHLHWLVLPITFIILVAVGSDYNLLLNRPSQGGGGSRLEHRPDSRAREHRRRRDLRRSGVRNHHAGVAHQRSAHHRSGGHDRVHRSYSLTLDRAYVHRAVFHQASRAWFWWPTLVRSRPLRQPSDFAVVTR